MGPAAFFGSAEAVVTTTWTVRMVRELLAGLYGGRRLPDGSWYPHTQLVAQRRHVSPRTVQRWIAGELDEPAPIPHRRLGAIRKGHTITRAMRERETWERANLEQISTRKRLGRGRGNLNEYLDRGWLQPHLLLILQHPQRPLRRVAVTRAGLDNVARSQSGMQIVEIRQYEDRFTADLARLDLLAAVDPYRILLHTPKGKTRHWLTSAPEPASIPPAPTDPSIS